MPTQEEALQELLDNLEAEEAKSKQDDEKPENPNFKQLRDHAKRLERDLKKAQAEAEELRKFRDETTAEMQKASLLGAGLSPRQSEVFLRAYDTVTPENIAEFRRDVLGASDEEEPVTERFQPTGFVGERVQETIDRKALEELWKKNPVKAQEMLTAGRVRFRKGQGVQ